MITGAGRHGIKDSPAALSMVLTMRTKPYANAVVETADIGDNVAIREFAVVRRGARIGNDVVIHPHVVIGPGVVIGDGVEIFPGAFLGKEPKAPGTLARKPVFARRITIGTNTTVGPGAVIYYDVEIGEDVLIGDSASVREGCRIGARSIIGRFVSLNYNVNVGNDVKIMDFTWLAGNMSLGDGVFVSGGVLTANDNSLGASDDVERMRGPNVEEGAAIGVGAILLPGITVRKNAVVAAGAVVTRDVPPDTVVMGVPAHERRRHRSLDAD